MNSDMVFRAYTEILFWKGDNRQQEDDSDSPVSACYTNMSALY